MMTAALANSGLWIYPPNMSSMTTMRSSTKSIIVMYQFVSGWPAIRPKREKFSSLLRIAELLIR